MKPPFRRIVNFTPLNTPLDQVQCKIGDDPAFRWPEKLKGDLSKWSRDKYCHFHHNHRHDTSNYYELKSQTKALIRKGKLQQFVRNRTDKQPPQGAENPRKVDEQPRTPLGEIKVIIGGSALGATSRASRKAYLWMVQSA